MTFPLTFIFVVMMLISHCLLAFNIRSSYAHWRDCWPGEKDTRLAFCYYYPDHRYHTVSCELLSASQQQQAACPPEGAFRQ